MKTAKAAAPCAAFLIAAFLMGCGTVDPRTIPPTALDEETYVFPAEDRDALQKLVRAKGKPTISVNVNTSAVTQPGLDLNNVAVNLQGEIQSALDSLAFLRVVTANDDLIAFVNSGYGGEAPADLPDYILLARLTYVSATRDTSVTAIGALATVAGATGTGVAAAEGKTTSAVAMGIPTAGAAAATAMATPNKVNVKVYFELYDRGEGRTMFSKMIAKEESGVMDSGISDAVQRLLAWAASEYMEQIVHRIGPIGIVMKTAGGRRYAYISLGEEAGLKSDGRVQFLQLEEKFTDIDVDSYVDPENEEEKDKANAKPRLTFESVADGHVCGGLLPEPKRAWVEVDGYDKSNPRVKKGMAVRLVPVSRKEGFFARFGIGGHKQP